MTQREMQAAAKIERLTLNISKQEQVIKQLQKTLKGCLIRVQYYRLPIADSQVELGRNKESLKILPNL